MPVPKIDIVKVILPILIRLCPELKAGQITKGLVIPLKDVNPINEAEEARNLSRKFERQPRQGGKDSSYVINLDRAIKCVEESGQKGGLVSQVLRKCVLVLIQGGEGKSNVTEDLLNPLIECLRSHALTQKNPRDTKRTTKKGRPAVGHGHGRTAK